MHARKVGGLSDDSTLSVNYAFYKDGAYFTRKAFIVSGSRPAISSIKGIETIEYLAFDVSQLLSFPAIISNDRSETLQRQLPRAKQGEQSSAPSLQDLTLGKYQI